MSTPPQPPGAKPSGPTSDERTRDIRLPLLPERPTAVVRPEGQSHVRPGPAESGAPGPAPARPDAAVPDAALPDAAVPDAEQPGAAPTAAQPTTVSDHASGAPPATETVRRQQPSPEALTRRADTTDGQPTDKLSSPARVREQTLAFDAPAGGSPRPVASGSPFPDFAAPAPSVPRAAPVSPRPSYPSPGAGAPSHGSATYGVGEAPTGKRRWPWVVLILLPILVIAISGVLLFLLLAGA